MFAMLEPTAMDIEYGIRFAPWGILVLLLLIFLVPMTMFLTVLFPSWNDLKRSIATHAGETGTKITGALHWHPHPKVP